MSRTFRNKSYCYMRSPKTFQEVRENNAALEEGVKVRKARTKRHLPNSYDDITVASIYEQDFKKDLTNKDS